MMKTRHTFPDLRLTLRARALREQRAAMQKALADQLHMIAAVATASKEERLAHVRGCVNCKRNIAEQARAGVPVPAELLEAAGIERTRPN